MQHVSKVARGLYRYYAQELSQQGERTLKVVGIGMAAKLMELRGAKALSAIMEHPVYGTAARVLDLCDGENIDTDVLLSLLRDEATLGKISVWFGKSEKWTFSAADIETLARYIKEA